MGRSKIQARPAKGIRLKATKVMSQEHLNDSESSEDLFIGMQYPSTHNDYNTETEGGLRSLDGLREVEYEYETPVAEQYMDRLPEASVVDSQFEQDVFAPLTETDGVLPQGPAIRDLEPISSDLEQHTGRLRADQRFVAALSAEESENIFVDHTGTLDSSFPPRSVFPDGLIEDDGANRGVESSDSDFNLIPSKKRKAQKQVDLKCHICWKAVTSKGGFSVHVNSHRKQKIFNCQLCITPSKFSAQTVEKLFSHLKMKHSEYEPTPEQRKDSMEIAQRKNPKTRPEGELRKPGGSPSSSSTDSDYNQESEQDDDETDISFGSTTTEEEPPAKRPAASASRPNELGLARGEQKPLSGNQKRNPNVTKAQSASTVVRTNPANKIVRAGLNSLTADIVAPKARFDEHTRDKQRTLENIATISAKAQGKAPLGRVGPSVTQNKRKRNDLPDEEASLINGFTIQKKARAKDHEDAGFTIQKKTRAKDHEDAGFTIQKKARAKDHEDAGFPDTFSIQKKAEFRTGRPEKAQSNKDLRLAAGFDTGGTGPLSSKVATREVTLRPQGNATPNLTSVMQSQSGTGRFFCMLCTECRSEIRNTIVIHMHVAHNVGPQMIDKNVGDSGEKAEPNANNIRGPAATSGSNVNYQPQTNQKPQYATREGTTDFRAKNQTSGGPNASQYRKQAGRRHSHASRGGERAPRADVDFRGHAEQGAGFDRKNRVERVWYSDRGSGSYGYAGRNGGVQKLNGSNSNDNLTIIGIENKLRSQSAYDGYRGSAAADDTVMALPSEDDGKDFDVERELEMERVRQQSVAKVEREAEETRRRLAEAERSRGPRRLFADWGSTNLSVPGPSQVPPPPAVPPLVPNFARNHGDHSRSNLHGIQRLNPYSSGLNTGQHGSAADINQQREHLQQSAFAHHRAVGDSDDSDKSGGSSSSESSRSIMRNADDENPEMKTTEASGEEAEGSFIHTGIHTEMLARMKAEDAARAAAAAAANPSVENHPLVSSPISGTSNNPHSEWDGLGLSDRVKTILDSGDYSELDSGMGLSKNFFEQPAIVKKMRQSAFMFFTYVSDSEPESYETDGSDSDDDEDEANQRESGLRREASNQNAGTLLLQPKPQRLQYSAEKVAQWIGGGHRPGASAGASQSLPNSLILSAVNSSANSVASGDPVTISAPRPEVVFSHGDPNSARVPALASPLARVAVDDSGSPNLAMDDSDEEAVPARPPSPYQEHPRGGEAVRPLGIVQFEWLSNPTARLDERELYVYHQTKDLELKKVKKLRATDSTIRSYYDEKEQWAKTAFLKSYQDKAKLQRDMDEFRKIHELGIEQTWLRELVVAEVRENYLRGKVDERELLPFWGDCHILGELLVDFFLKNNNRGCVNTMELIDRLGFAGNDLKAKNSDLMKTICYVRNQMKRSEQDGLNRKTSFQNVIDKINSFGKKWSACFKEFESTLQPGRSHRDTVLSTLNVVVIKDEKSDYRPRNVADLKSILKRRASQTTALPAGPGAGELAETNLADPIPPVQEKPAATKRRTRVNVHGPVSIVVIPREGRGLSAAEAMMNPPAKQPPPVEDLDPAVHGYNIPRDPPLVRAITASRIAVEHKAMKVSTEENPLALVYGSPLPNSHKSISMLVSKLDRINGTRKFQGLPSYSDPPDIMVNSVCFRQASRGEAHTEE